MMAVLFVAAVFVVLTGIVAPSDRSSLLFCTIIELIFLVCAVVFSKLTIRIDDEALRAFLALGITCEKVSLAEIVACEPIRIQWWHGWGIHLTPYGWLYNVSGLDAVAITLRNRQKFALGTDDQNGLITAIREGIR
jgi:hypothetical protein